MKTKMRAFLGSAAWPRSFGRLSLWLWFLAFCRPWPGLLLCHEFLKRRIPSLTIIDYKKPSEIIYVFTPSCPHWGCPQRLLFQISSFCLFGANRIQWKRFFWLFTDSRADSLASFILIINSWWLNENSNFNCHHLLNHIKLQVNGIKWTLFSFKVNRLKLQNCRESQ